MAIPPTCSQLSCTPALLGGEMKHDVPRLVGPNLKLLKPQEILFTLAKAAKNVSLRRIRPLKVRLMVAELMAKAMMAELMVA